MRIPAAEDMPVFYGLKRKYPPDTLTKRVFRSIYSALYLSVSQH